VKSSSSSHSSIASSSSSSSASSESSSSSSAEVIPLTTGTEECHFSLFDPGSYVRDCYGYNVPVIDPASIAHLEEVSRSGDVIGTNILLSLLFTIVIGLSGLVFAFLSRLAPELLHRVLRRLPLQLVITLLLIWLWNVFVPAASAQGLTAASGVSLLSLPLYAFLFFLVIGVSNFIFNNIVTSEGDAIHEFIVSHPLLDRIIGGGKRLSHEKWLVLLLIFAYGIVGAYINPQFSLFPSHQVGIVLVTVIAIILSAYFKDFMRFLLARSWKCNAWFKANVGGHVVVLHHVADHVGVAITHILLPPLRVTNPQHFKILHQLFPLAGILHQLHLCVADFIQDGVRGRFGAVIGDKFVCVFVGGGTFYSIERSSGVGFKRLNLNGIDTLPASHHAFHLIVRVQYHISAHLGGVVDDELVPVELLLELLRRF
jgi:hypothetical protein